MKLAVDEVGSGEMRKLWEEGLPMAASAIGYSELCCALAGVVRSGRLPVAAAEQVLELANGIWKRVVTVGVEGVLARHAGALGARHSLRALDAIHVATALTLAEAGPIVVSWDRRLRRAVAAEGLAVYPETTTAALR